MKKMLLTLATLGALAVPFGVALADDEPTDPTEPVSTSIQPEQLRDRDRLHADDATSVSERTRERDRDCSGVQIRLDGATPADTEVPAEDVAPSTDVDGARLHLRYGAGRADR